MYASLPVELQLNILSQSSDLHQLQNIDKHHRDLTHYIIKSKLQHYLEQNTPTLSLFSPNNKESNIKNFYNVEYEISSQYTHFQISSLHHKENLFTKDSNTKPSFSLNQHNHLDLVLNEDQTTTKVSLALLFNNTPASYDTSMKLNKHKLNGSLHKSGMQTNYEFEEGELEPAKGGYDYEMNYNYSLNFEGGFKIDNFELLKVLENGEEMIVRY